jgi:hypothetical protein
VLFAPLAARAQPAPAQPTPAPAQPVQPTPAPAQPVQAAPAVPAKPAAPAPAPARPARAAGGGAAETKADQVKADERSTQAVSPSQVPSEPTPGPRPAPPAVEEKSSEATPAPAPSGAANPETPPATPQDLESEIQGLRDDHQGLQTDLENFKFQWQRERDLHTAITTRGLIINGVIQAQYGFIDQQFSNAVVYKRKNTFNIGAAIIAFNGTLYRDYEEGRNLTYSLRYGASPQTNTTNSFLNVLDANITYQFLPTIDPEKPTLAITVGQQLLPFGIEVPATEELKPVIRNAEFTTRSNLARRDIGAFIKGDLIPRMDYGYNYRQAAISYAVGVIDGSGPNTMDDNDNKDFIGRLAFTVPSDYNSFLRQITIGATGYWGKQTTYLADTAKTISGKGSKRRLGLDLYYNHWPFGLTYEFIAAKDGVTTGTTLAAAGRKELTSQGHVATFFLSFGEQFEAGFRNQGRYDDWWPKTYQPFVRYDRYVPDTSAEKTTRVEVWTLGLNVFFAETTKLQVNYNRRDDKTNKLGASNEVLGQVQFGF